MSRIFLKNVNLEKDKRILTAEITEKAEKMKPRDFTDFHKIENKK